MASNVRALGLGLPLPSCLSVTTVHFSDVVGLQETRALGVEDFFSGFTGRSEHTIQEKP